MEVILMQLAVRKLLFFIKRKIFRALFLVITMVLLFEYVFHVQTVAPLVEILNKSFVHYVLPFLKKIIQA